jgi:hypothetical protein
MDRNELPPKPRHLGVPLGASKPISELMVRLAQTVLLSCSDTNTVSKRTKTRFHMSHVTLEFHQVRPKWFPGLWYVRLKQCTYLESRLALCPNGPKRASTWASSSWSTIGSVQMISKPMVRLAQTVHLSCTDANTISKQTEPRFVMTHITLEFHRVVQNDFRAYGTFGEKQCTYLASRLALSPNGWNELPLEPPRLGVPLGASKMISEPIVHLAQIVHLSCSDTNTVSEQTKTRFHMSHIT